MKILLIAVSLLVVSSVSGQTLAKKHHHKSSVVVDQMSVPAFRDYVSEVNKKITYNDLQISDLRFLVINLQTKFNSKIVRRVTELQQENDELKTDLENFSKYGLGDWKIFQVEFNPDLQVLSSDIDYIHSSLVKDYLLSSR